MTEIKLTVVSICYNQEQFIAQTLDSFLQQKTSFPFEVIIADDCSTDNTAIIIAEYAKKYPEIIKPILRKKNIGIIDNYIDTLAKVKSKYVIYNEGDDYFINPLKLQKQVDFLDTNPECAICFHPVLAIWEDESKPSEIFPPPSLRWNKNILELSDLLKHNFIQTNSCMYRWRFNDEEKIEDIFPKDILPADHFLHLLHAETGSIGFLQGIMSVYRKWNGGIWDGAGETDAWFIRCGLKHINFYKEVEKKFHKDFSYQINEFSRKVFLASVRNKDWENLRLFSKKYPILFKEASTSNEPD